MYLGEISEWEGDRLDTLQLWEEALKLDRNVGIEDRYLDLKKRMDRVYGGG